MTTLDNPAWSALTGAHLALAVRHGNAARYPAEVSPLVGLADSTDPRAWADLATLVGPGEVVPLGCFAAEPLPHGWETAHRVRVVQMTGATASGGTEPEVGGSGTDPAIGAPATDPTVPPLGTDPAVGGSGTDPVVGVPAPDTVVPPLGAEPAVPTPGADAAQVLGADPAVGVLGAGDVPEMLDLVRRARPGPFGPRTVEMGTYLGIRHGGRLVAMAGQRLRADGWTEISAVATDPDHRGRGLAGRVVRALVSVIRGQGAQPFLHVAASNTPAIRLYRSLGFVTRAEPLLLTVRAPSAAGVRRC